MNIGSNIRAIRERHGLTLEQVGECLGTSKQFINNIERGLRIPSINQLISICSVLHCTPNDILGFTKQSEYE